MTRQIPRELTAAERRAIRRSVLSECAGYDSEHGCLPLNGDCYMLNKCWTGGYCRYFEETILPAYPVLERALKYEPPANTKLCAICGRPFPTAGRKSYCSEKCREQGRKIADTRRAKKYRRNKGLSVTD
jgi:hypothetical protein